MEGRGWRRLGSGWYETPDLEEGRPTRLMDVGEFKAVVVVKMAKGGKSDIAFARCLSLSGGVSKKSRGGR